MSFKTLTGFAVLFRVSCLAIGLHWAGANTCSALIYVDISPTVDGSLSDMFNDGSFEELLLTGTILQTTSFANSSQVGFDIRAALEFDLTPANLGLVLHSATFVGFVDGISHPEGFAEISIDLLGYTGDGQVTLSDAHASDTTIGIYTTEAGIPGLGRRDSLLDKNFVAELLEGGDYLGILTRAHLNAGGITIRSSESTIIPEFDLAPPFLRLAFVVPEPSSIAFVAIAVGCHVIFFRGRINKISSISLA